jgi:hypothetical protein
MDLVSRYSYLFSGECQTDYVGDMDFLSLPFELGAVDGGNQDVTEQEVTLQSFGSDWFK